MSASPTASTCTTPSAVAINVTAPAISCLSTNSFIRSGTAASFFSSNFGTGGASARTRVTIRSNRTTTSRRESAVGFMARSVDRPGKDEKTDVRYAEHVRDGSAGPPAFGG